MTSFEPSSLNACRGTGAFPPRPLLKENQKNNNELKANEGDPQLEQGTRDLSYPGTISTSLKGERVRRVTDLLLNSKQQEQS